MFIHIAKDKFIRRKEIIGVFDLDTSTVSAVTKNFLGRAEKNGHTVDINVLPNSFVLAGENKKNKIYFSSNMTGHINKFQKHRLSTYQRLKLLINDDL